MSGKKLLCLLLLSWMVIEGRAQNVHQIVADSVKVTGANGSGEFIIENSSRNVPGFLTNTGNGRTQFAKMLRLLNDTVLLIGPDTLKIPRRGSYVSLNKPDTISGIKTFNPVVKSLEDTVVATIFESTFDAPFNKDSLLGVDFRNVPVADLIWPHTIYSGRFYDKVIFDGNITFYKRYAYVQDSVFHSSGWIRGVDSQAMVLKKPVDATPALLVIKPLASIAIKSLQPYFRTPTVFQDSVFFTSGAQDYTFIKQAPVVRQQPGATGALRGFYMEPRLTGVVDFRGVQVDMTAGSGAALYAPGTAPSIFGGELQYLGNYHSQLTARSVIDKGYIDSAAGGKWLEGANHSAYRLQYVGIGANASTIYPLSVNGIFIADKMLVTNEVIWPDYVFDSNYVLMPLSTLRDYVRQHKHLPGVPDAVTVEKNGIDIAETQAALLKQVEELTLHLIRHKQQQDIQNDRLDQLEKRMVTMSSVSDK